MTDAPTSVLSSPIAPAAERSLAVGLAPLVVIVFLGSLAVGVPLSALPVHVHDGLGFRPVVVGLVVGVQSVVTVLTRHAAGTLTDVRGPRRAVLVGLPLAALAGLLYLASDWGTLGNLRIAPLIAGRLVAGLAESLFLTGTMSWGIGRVGARRTGSVMAWQGIALYLAVGLGAPLGLAAQASFGFRGVAIATIVPPLLALAIAARIAPVPGGTAVRVPFYRVVGLIWLPGLVLTLATVPFAAMATALALDFAARGWSGAGLALAGFAGGYVAVRLVGSHWPDRHGGMGVAGVSLAVEAAGQVLLWLAPSAALATAGAVLTGLGFSLVFPAMGVEATRRVPADQRGRAVGNFIAFFDLALAVTGPVVGLVAVPFGFAAAFLVGALATSVALGLVEVMRRGAP